MAAGQGLIARAVFWLLPSGIYLVAIWKGRWWQPLGLGFPLGSPQIWRTLLVTSLVSGLLVLGTATQMGLSPLSLLSDLARHNRPDWSAPLLEELVFRGVILSELLDWTFDSSKNGLELRAKFWAIQLGAALLFLSVHLPWWLSHLGFAAALRMSLPVFTTGLILGFVFAHTRSLWACILLHWLNNQLSLVAT